MGILLVHQVSLDYEHVSPPSPVMRDDRSGQLHGAEARAEMVMEHLQYLVDIFEDGLHDCLLSVSGGRPSRTVHAIDAKQARRAMHHMS